MKNIKYLFILLAGILVFTACEKEKEGPYLNPVPDAPKFVTPTNGQSYVLTEAEEDETFETFSWTAANYGFQAPALYTLQVDEAGNGFADKVDVIATNQLGAEITGAEMNSVLLAMGATPGQPVSLEARVFCQVQQYAPVVMSNVISMDVTPYEKVIIYPSVYVPGSYQAASGYEADWSPDKAPELISLLFNDKYEGYVYMANGSNQFKFTDGPNWDLNWGDDGADGTLDQNGANIELANPGYYKMNVDLTAMTYSIQNTTWGIIGSAPPPYDWSADVDMTYDMNTRVWSVTLDLNAGELKFRANDGWDLNYGDTGADGKLDQGGDNIQVGEAGNYTVILDLSKAPYTYSLTKN